MEFIFILGFVAIILAAFYFYLTWNYNFWEKQGVPYVKNIIPGLGNMAPVLFMRENLSSMCEKLYKNNKCSMLGFYQLTTPTLLVRDPELVKSVLLTNFANFPDNQFQVGSSKLDRIFAVNPFFSRTDTWKENRAPLSNAFSSKKLKLMLPFVQDVTSKLEAYLKRKTDLHQGKLEVELKQFSNMFTGEVAATGIGIQGHDFQDETEATKEQWAYKRFIEKFFSEQFFTGGVQQLIFLHLPKIASLMNLTMVPQYVNTFFRTAIGNIVSYRKRESKTSNDYTQILIDYYRANKLNVEDNETLVSHTVTFAIEIYESSAITLSYMLFQLGAHPEIQEKVRKEINSVLEKCNGKLDYENLKDMTYFDQVLNESMRLNHVIGTFTKICTKETHLVGSDGISCVMKPGNVAVISTYGLQMDPNHWPDPEKFDPDRFSQEQKANRHKFTFLPFGEGPRICVGMRMAIMMIKLVSATILRNYSLQVSPKTPLPLKKSEGSFMTAFEKGLWVYLIPLKGDSTR